MFLREKSYFTVKLSVKSSRSAAVPVLYVRVSSIKMTTLVPLFFQRLRFRTDKYVKKTKYLFLSNSLVATLCKKSRAQMAKEKIKKPQSWTQTDLRNCQI